MHVCVGCQKEKQGRLLRIFDLSEKRCVDRWVCYDCRPYVTYEDRVAEQPFDPGFKLQCEQPVYYRRKDGEDIIESRRYHRYPLGRYF